MRVLTELVDLNKAALRDAAHAFGINKHVSRVFS